MRFPMSRKKITLIGAVLAAGAVGLIVSRPSAAPQPSKAATPAAIELAASDVVTVTRGPIDQPIPLSGSLTPIRQSVLNAQVEAVVAEVFVRPGQVVKAGQLLARLDTRDLQDQLSGKAASLERSKAELALAEKNRTRSADLLKQHFISPNSHDATESSYAVAAAQVKADQAQFAIARKALDEANVRAPFSGVISERFVEPGTRVGFNEKLFGLVDLSELEYAADVPLAQLPQIKPGQAASVKVEGFGARKFMGVVERIAPVAQSGSRMVPVYVHIKNQDGALKGGMFVQGQVIVGHLDDANTLPLSAVRNLGAGQAFVLAVDQGKVVRHDVTLGLTNDLTKVATIRTGVQAGEPIVIAKVDSIKPGQAVKLAAADKN
ncbi:MAG: efflux RND transporter periplasmic adaptor subunit [Burkholderiales bacterium]|nr:efflux RND transporter periplasmic adaptor subunit [Burkholderiales bacterium]